MRLDAVGLLASGSRHLLEHSKVVLHAAGQLDVLGLRFVRLTHLACFGLGPHTLSVEWAWQLHEIGVIQDRISE